MKRRTHSWDREPEPVMTIRRTAPADTTDRRIARERKMKSGFGDNPPVRIEIVYTDGSMDILKGEQIDADNPVLQALANIRTCRRFWRLASFNVDKPQYSTDQELIEDARKRGYKTNKAEEAAEVLNCVCEYFLTGADGEPLTDEDGLWIVADPHARGTFTPGTHTGS